MIPVPNAIMYFIELGITLHVAVGWELSRRISPLTAPRTVENLIHVIQGQAERKTRPSNFAAPLANNRSIIPGRCETLKG